MVKFIEINMEKFNPLCNKDFRSKIAVNVDSVEDISVTKNDDNKYLVRFCLVSTGMGFPRIEEKYETEKEANKRYEEVLKLLNE